MGNLMSDAAYAQQRGFSPSEACQKRHIHLCYTRDVLSRHHIGVTALHKNGPCGVTTPQGRFRPFHIKIAFLYSDSRLVYNIRSIWQPTFSDNIRLRQTISIAQDVDFWPIPACHDLRREVNICLFRARIALAANFRSHCPSVGCIVDNFPPGIPVSEEILQPQVSI